MATTHTNTGSSYSDPTLITPRGTMGSITADDKPQSRTMLWVAIGILLLGVIVWALSGTNSTVDNDRMDRPDTGQVAPR